jgi:hypothetical protein
MKLSLSRILSAALLLLSGGCKMCCPAYDYCSPTNPQGDQTMCCDHGRRGSYFNGDSGYYGEQVVGQETVVEQETINEAPQDAPAPPPMNVNPGDALPPAVNPAPAVNPPVNPAPAPRGPMTSRPRTPVMHPTSRRAR